MLSEKSNENNMKDQVFQQQMPSDIIAFADLSQATLINDATKAWNRAPKEVLDSKSYNIAKVNIKMFAKTLPI